jgi:D-alanyl-D-alanine endopeptidase (penicillin-binding protein 7)
MNAYTSHVIGSLGWTLVHFLWQGLILGCATALLLTGMRNTRPEHRYTVACTALFLCLAWPAFEFWQRLQDAGTVTSSGQFAAAASLSVREAADVSDYLQTNLVWVVSLWAACAGALTLRIGLGLLWVRRAARQPSGDAAWQAKLERMATQFGIGRTVRLRVVANLASPITAGWWSPVVLVPASLITGMPPHLLEALLAHELAHVKRHDYLVNLGQNVVETLLFYHPAVWWISGRIRAEREQIADDIAASQLGEPRRLALALSELERFQFSSHHLAQAANGGDLMTRIKRLVRPDTQALNWKAAIPVLGLAATLLSACATTSSDTAKAEPVRTPAVADFRTCAKPVWPKESLRLEQTGKVTMAFLIGADGKVKDSNIEKSSGFKPLDEAAQAGIAKCLFKPGTVDGKPVEAWMKMQYIWTLK